MKLFLEHAPREFAPDGKSCSQQHLGAFEEDGIPDPEHNTLGKTGGEEREEPLHGEHVGEGRLVAGSRGNVLRRVLQLVQAAGQGGQGQVKQVAEHGHVDRQGSQVVREVAVGKHLVYQVDHHLDNSRVRSLKHKGYLKQRIFTII